MNRVGFWAHGRHVVMVIDKELDSVGQFGVHVSVDEKERWAAFFTPRDEDAQRPPE